MPELPDLEAVKNILDPELTNMGIADVEVLQPRVIQRPPVLEFGSVLVGDYFSWIKRRGKFLLFKMASGHTIAIHPMLSGRFQYCEQGQQRLGTCLIFPFEELQTAQIL